MILQSHIPLMRTACEPQFFDLDPILEPNLTLKFLLDLNQIFKSVLVPVPLTLNLKSTFFIKSHSIIGHRCRTL